MSEEYSRLKSQCNLCGDYFSVLDLEFAQTGGRVYCKTCIESEIAKDE